MVISNNAYSRGTFKEIQMDGLREEFRQLTAVAPKVAMVGNTPRLPAMPGVCLSSRGVDLGDCLLPQGRKQSKLQGWFRNVAREEGVDFVNAMPWFCADGSCPSVIGNFIPMRDKDHVTTPYAEHLADALARRLELDR